MNDKTVVSRFIQSVTSGDYDCCYGAFKDNYSGCYTHDDCIAAYDVSNKFFESDYNYFDEEAFECVADNFEFTAKRVDNSGVYTDWNAEFSNGDTRALKAWVKKQKLHI